MDPLSMLVGGKFLIVGVAIGRFTKRRSSLPATPTHSLSSCDHGYGSHEDGRVCHAEIERARPGVLGGSYEWVACPCRFYDGPEPLPRVWTEGL